MNPFQPTDDQLLDYHLGQTDAALSAQIQAYLATHPKAAQKLSEYQDLEKAFAAMPLDTPSDQVLQKVVDQATKLAKPNPFAAWFSTFTTRRVAWAMALVLVVGLSVVLKDLRQGAEQASLQPKAPKETSALATFKPAETSEQPSLQPNQNQQALSANQKYTKALAAIESQDYQTAHRLFESILSQNPDFDQKVALYQNWVEVLTQLGHEELAAQKRELLEVLK